MREVDVSQPNRASNIAKKSRNMITGSRGRHIDAANFRKAGSATEKTYGALYGTRSEAPPLTNSLNSRTVPRPQTSREGLVLANTDRFAID